MSIRAMSWVWENSPYEGVGLLVHLSLADFSDDYGVCWPSQKRIADKCKSSERHVRRVIAQMITDGQIVLLSKSNGSTTNNRYELTFMNSHRTPRPADKQTKITQDFQDIVAGHLSPAEAGHRSPDNHHITINNHHEKNGPPIDVKLLIEQLRMKDA